MADAPTLFDAPCSDSHVFVQRLGATGVIGAPVAVTPDDMWADQPRAAWNGSEWVVTWMKLIPLPVLVSPPPTRGNVYAARVSAEFAVLDTQPIPIAVSDFFESSPLVATDGREFVIAWSHQSFDDKSGIYIRRIQNDGAANEPSVIARGPCGMSDFLFDGKRYALAFTRFPTNWTADAFLTHLDGDEVALSATDTDERYSSIVAPRGRRLRAVYTRVAPEPEYGGVSRVFMRDAMEVRRRSVRSR
jgi:hypothetical protein